MDNYVWLYGGRSNLLTRLSLSRPNLVGRKINILCLIPKGNKRKVVIKMTNNEVNHKLVDSKFKVFVGGEFERQTNFWGLAKLITHYTDFSNWTTSEKNQFLKELVETKSQLIDSTISVRMI